MKTDTAKSPPMKAHMAKKLRKNRVRSSLGLSAKENTPT